MHGPAGSIQPHPPVRHAERSVVVSHVPPLAAGVTWKLRAAVVTATPSFTATA